jgi:hypothetical protein
MPDPRAFCRAVMHEYERQWSRGGGHAVRHPLRLKMDRLTGWCDESYSPAEFERRLQEASRSEDVADALLADELVPLWRTVREGGSLPFTATQ